MLEIYLAYGKLYLTRHTFGKNYLEGMSQSYRLKCSKKGIDWHGPIVP